MKISELKAEIIDDLGASYETKIDRDLFTQDINGCNNWLDILNVLDAYGYDKQYSLDIMFNILIEKD
jgi:hypothetical protein